MDRCTYKKLSDEFYAAESVELKVDLLLKHDLKTLTNPQIEKLLDGLSEESTRKLINVISKKIGE